MLSNRQPSSPKSAQTASPTPAAAASDVNVVVIVIVAEETASEFQLDRWRER